MKIFLSYSSAQRNVAERIYAGLAGEGHDVFFDRDSLPAGDTYDRRIREAVSACQLFIFLVSAESLEPGCYALTELALVEAEPPASRPALLPVKVAAFDYAQVPAFLGARTIYEPRGNVAAEVAAQVEQIRRTIERPAPRLIASRTNQGWLVYLDFGIDRPTEVSFRLSADTPWQSTGFTGIRHPADGKPMPRTDLMLSPRAPAVIHVRYTDEAGRVQGPFALPFDTRAQFLSSVREALRFPPWISFREFDGRLLVYFSSLLSYKDAFTAIRYSVDDTSLSQSVRFTADPARMGLGIASDDEAYVEIPKETRSVSVQVEFIDGAKSELQTFRLDEWGVTRG